MEKDYISELKKALENTNLKINFEKLDADKDFFEQGIDSFDHVMMLFAIEEYFKISVSDEDLNSGALGTLNKLINYISNAKGEQK